MDFESKRSRTQEIKTEKAHNNLRNSNDCDNNSFRLRHSDILHKDCSRRPREKNTYNFHKQHETRKVSNPENE